MLILMSQRGTGCLSGVRSGTAYRCVALDVRRKFIARISPLIRLLRFAGLCDGRWQTMLRIRKDIKAVQHSTGIIDIGTNQSLYRRKPRQRARTALETGIRESAGQSVATVQHPHLAHRQRAQTAGSHFLVGMCQRHVHNRRVMLQFMPAFAHGGARLAEKRSLGPELAGVPWIIGVRRFDDEVSDILALDYECVNRYYLSQSLARIVQARGAHP